MTDCPDCNIKTNVPRTEHECRLQDPDKFVNDSFVRKDVTADGSFEGRPLTVILARPVSADEGTLEAQSLRYPIESWEAAEARQHCKDSEREPEQIEKFTPAQPKQNESVDSVFQEWQKHVNMTASEMEQWMEHPCSTKASVEPRQVQERNLNLLQTNKDDWGDEEVEAAQRAISFISRMSDESNKPEDPKSGGPNGCPSECAISLLNWGFNPFSELPAVPDELKDNSKFCRGNLKPSGKPERRTLHDEPHIVVPVIGLQEQVMRPANSGTPELIPEDEIRRSVLSWNGRPVVVSHPSFNGRATLANQPEIFNNEVVGHLFNSRVEEGKLKFDAWISLTKAQRIGGKVERTVNSLAEGSIVEVSTGLIADSEQKSGVHNNERFEGIWHNIIPDHLAILPLGEKGACSVEDGCGANRFNASPSEVEVGAFFEWDSSGGTVRGRAEKVITSGELDVPDSSFTIEATESDPAVLLTVFDDQGNPTDTKVGHRASELRPIEPITGGTHKDEDRMKQKQNTVNDTARTPDFDGTSTEEWSRPDFQDFLTGFFKFNPDAERDENNPPNSVDELTQAQRNWFASKSLLGNADAETFDDLTFFPVVNPRTNMLVENALQAVISGRGAQAEIEQDAKESAMETSRQLLRKHFGRGEEKENSAEKALQNSGIDATVLFSNSTTFHYVVNSGGRARPEIYVGHFTANGSITNYHQTEDQFLSKKEKVNFLIANSDKFTEESRQELEALSESTLDALGEAASPAETQDILANADGWTREALELGQKNLQQHRSSLISQIKNNSGNPFDEETLNSKPLDELEKLAKLAAPGVDYSAVGGVRTNAGEKVNGARKQPPRAPSPFE